MEKTSYNELFINHLELKTNANRFKLSHEISFFVHIYLFLCTKLEIIKGIYICTIEEIGIETHITAHMTFFQSQNQLRNFARISDERVEFS